MPTPVIRVLPDPQSVAHAAAEHIVASASAAINNHGSFSIALAGGNTPRQLYELLASDTYVRRLHWDHIHIYFTDERCVPPEHLESNFRMASDALLDVVPIPPQNIHRMRGEIDPEPAAIEYGRMLKDRFGDGGLDLAILGMGEDGHTASLFPASAALHETHHRCAANYVEKLQTWRITLTAGFLNRSSEVLVLVTGTNKSAAVQQVLEGPSDPYHLPIQLIDPPHGRVTWLLDAPAAGMQG